jgi:hypothetical protein
MVGGVCVCVCVSCVHTLLWGKKSVMKSPADQFIHLATSHCETRLEHLRLEENVFFWKYLLIPCKYLGGNERTHHGFLLPLGRNRGWVSRGEKGEQMGSSNDQGPAGFHPSPLCECMARQHPGCHLCSLCDCRSCKVTSAGQRGGPNESL